MKRFYITIFALIAGYYCTAQQSGQNGWVISFDNYFEPDSTSETSVNLYAKPNYISTSWQSKSFVIDNILSMRNKKVAYVSYGHKWEIWGKDATQTVKLLDSLDLNNSHNLEDVVAESQRLVKHPWFVYFGGQTMFSTETFMLSLNSRIGFFLLLDQWDLALSLAASASEETSTVSIGLASKYYFPTTIKKQRISPYLGGGIDFSYYGNDIDTEPYYIEDTQVNLSVLAGVSWALGPGSFDLGIQYGKVSKFGITVGYTFFPWGR